MKKLLAAILAFTFILAAFSACSKNETETTTGKPQETTTEKTQETTAAAENDTTKKPSVDGNVLSGSASDIIDAIYTQSKVELNLTTQSVDLTDKDALKAYTGLDDASKIKEAAVSEPLIGSQAYSLVVVKVNDKADTKDVADAIIAGINPAKWICVCADGVKLEAKDDVIMLFMVEESLNDVVTLDAVTDAFKTIAGGAVDFELTK